MKKFVISIFILCMIVTAGMSSYAETLPEQTTDKEILFQGIRWFAEPDTAEKAVKESFPEIDDISRKTAWLGDYVYNFSDSGAMLPMHMSKHLEAYTYTFQKKGPWESTHMSFGKVAGYNIDQIVMNFIKVGYSYELYKAEYAFDTLNTKSSISAFEQYTDLKGKLSDLYGTPYITEKSGGYVGKQEGALWIGANGSAVSLEYSKYTGGMLNGSELIYLKYGTTAANKYFINAETEAEEAADREAQEEREKVKDDHSGL